MPRKPRHYTHYPDYYRLMLVELSRGEKEWARRDYLSPPAATSARMDVYRYWSLLRDMDQRRADLPPEQAHDISQLVRIANNTTIRQEGTALIARLRDYHDPIDPYRDFGETPTTASREVVAANFERLLARKRAERLQEEIDEPTPAEPTPTTEVEPKGMVVEDDEIPYFIPKADDSDSDE